MNRAAIAICATIATLYSLAAHAEPYFAQREGYKCGKCHVNRTGGGKRTDFGHQYSRTVLRLLARSTPTDVKGSTTGVRTSMFSPRLNDYISLGANLRLNHETTFSDDTSNTFGNSEANIYLGVDLGPRVLLYTDLSVADGSVGTRETFALLSLPRGFYLKGGLILPPFGLRIWGEREYVRSITGYNYATPDLGLEFGVEGEMFSAFLAVSNGQGGGQDSDNYKKISLLTEFSVKAFRVGISGSYNRAGETTRVLESLYVGLSLGRLTLLAEGVLLSTIKHDVGKTVHSLIAYGEANLLLYRGLNLKVAYGYHDQDLDVGEDHRSTIRGGLECFVLPMVATTIFYTYRQSVPQDQVGNADSLIAELHVYF